MKRKNKGILIIIGVFLTIFLTINSILLNEDHDRTSERNLAVFTTAIYERILVLRSCSSQEEYIQCITKLENNEIDLNRIESYANYKYYDLVSDDKGIRGEYKEDFNHCRELYLKYQKEIKNFIENGNDKSISIIKGYEKELTQYYEYYNSRDEGDKKIPPDIKGPYK